METKRQRDRKRGGRKEKGKGEREREQGFWLSIMQGLFLTNDDKKGY